MLMVMALVVVTMAKTVGAFVIVDLEGCCWGDKGSDGGSDQ